MEKKLNLKRMLLLVVMRMTLTCIVAVSAFVANTLPATIVGGYGEIEGLEAGTTGAELHESEYSIKVPVDTKADLYIYVGEEYNDKTLEIYSYYQDIKRLRKCAESEVTDGWVVFNLYDQAYVICESK